MLPGDTVGDAHRNALLVRVLRMAVSKGTQHLVKIWESLRNISQSFCRGNFRRADVFWCGGLPHAVEEGTFTSRGGSERASISATFLAQARSPPHQTVWLYFHPAISHSPSRMHLPVVVALLARQIGRAVAGAKAG